MSIKGFIVNGTTQRYDYDALENKPPADKGVSDALKTALLQLAQKVAYIDTGGQTYYQALYDALYGTIQSFTVTNYLTDVINSNATSTVVEGGAYTATLSCASNYQITSVTITMGGEDVTNTAYSGGSISISNVTGNIVITAVATQRQATLSSISALFVQGTAVIYDTASLNSLKQYLTVTATWSDSTTSTVADSDYTLSGTLTTGTSTITVSYGGKTTTFTCTVTEAPLDTTPVLDTDHMNKGQSNTFGNYSNKTGFCPTIKYQLGTLSGTTYDYIKGIIPVDATGSTTCRAWFYKQDNSGSTGSAYGDGRPMQVYSDSMTEGQVQMNLSNNYVAMTIPCHVDYLADSYLYVASSGKVLFAGANTPYYGMENISEAS